MRWLKQYEIYTNKHLSDEYGELKICACISCYNSKIYNVEYSDLYIDKDRELVYIFDKNIKLNFSEISNISFEDEFNPIFED